MFTGDCTSLNVQDKLLIRKLNWDPHDVAVQNLLKEIYSLFFIALIHLHPPPPPQNRFCILCITECIEGCRGSKRCIAHSPKLFSQVDILSYFLTVTAPTRNYCTYVFWCDKCAYFVLQFFFFIKGLPEYFFFK